MSAVMRVDPELTYQDYKEGVIDCFSLLGDKGCETPRKLLTGWQMKMMTF